MITGIDHVVILAADLEPMISAYRSLGFVVARGGEHPRWQTENALVALAGGAYLELLAARNPAAAAGHRLWQRADGRPRRPGEYGGFMLGSNDLRADVTRWRAKGLGMPDPIPGARLRPDGQEVRWQLVYPDRRDLPLLIQDETPREVRVPAAAAGLNAVTRLAGVTVVVTDVAEAADAYGRLLGGSIGDPVAGSRARGSPGSTARTRSERFATPAGHITLVAPAPGEPAFNYLQTCGPGVFSITLAVAGRWPETLPSPDEGSGQEPMRLVDPRLTGGVRVFVEMASGGS
ncbi:MAG: VOC family protein [Armatimonadota bacterium]|nr:VOC family protein [Armatimonadota bacterium]